MLANRANDILGQSFALVFPAADLAAELSAAGGGGMGLFCAIAGGLNALKRKQALDKCAPLVSEDFMSQAGRIIAEATRLEAEIAADPDQAKQQRYDSLVLELEQLIAPSGDDEEDEDEE